VAFEIRKQQLVLNFPANGSSSSSAKTSGERCEGVRCKGKPTLPNFPAQVEKFGVGPTTSSNPPSHAPAPHEGTPSRLRPYLANLRMRLSTKVALNTSSQEPGPEMR
jgi:hypothetical protein